MLLLVWVVAPPGVSGQQPGNVILDANEQIFCVLAALNAAGYDSGLGVDTGDRTREEVRATLGRKDPPILPELRKFYVEQRVAGDPGVDLGQYLSLALLLGPPPDFSFAVPQTDLPPDAKALAGFVPILKNFYRQANLLDLWVRMQPNYQAQIQRYSDAVRRSITLSDAYLRFPSGAYLGRTYTIYLDLLGAPGKVHARIYGQNYYLVATPSRELKLDEVRHQYLHFLLDPLALKYAAEIQQRAELRASARQAPNLGTDFKEDFFLLVTECVIRAAELRMDKQPKAQAAKTVEELAASGFILMPYVYAALEEYEKQEASMNVFYRQMILGIDVTKEKQRLASVKFTPRAAPAPEVSSPALSEEERLLDQADNFFYEGRYNEARAAYQDILESLNPKSERALFGLAVVASNMRKPGLAEEYFQKTLAAARDLRIVTWSHIYLGRLYDLEGRREQALGHYRAASLTAPTYPDALRAVQSGLQHPFGSSVRR